MNNKIGKLLTGLLILISITGIFYLGYLTLKPTAERENPYKYDVSQFRKTDSSLVHYRQIMKIDILADRLHALAIDQSDRLYVAGDSSIFIYDNRSKFMTKFSVENPAICIAVSGSGEIYLGMTKQIAVYSKDGAKMDVWQLLKQKAVITSIARSENEIYVADAGNRIVYRFALDGSLIGVIDDESTAGDVGGFVIPSAYFDVAIDPDGFLWVVNPGRHALQSYNPDGTFRSHWMKSSMSIDGFCGCCNPTHIAILSNGSFVTSEKGIPRVKIVNRIGELTAIVAGPSEFTENTVGLDLAVDSNDRVYVLEPMRRAVLVFERK